MALYQVLKKHKWKWEVIRSIVLSEAELRKGAEKEIQKFHILFLSLTLIIVMSTPIKIIYFLKAKHVLYKLLWNQV